MRRGPAQVNYSMSFASAGEAASRQGGQPVRRHSRPAGREGLFWRPFDRQDVRRYMLAAERFERGGREKGKRAGPLGSVALEVLRELLRLVDYRTGRLEPAISTLCERVKRSRPAVVRALAALRRHGFLDWLRRYEPTGETGKGPRVRQVTNAYRLTLPPGALRLLGNLAKASPPPEDFETARAEKVAELRRMVNALPLDEQPGAIMGDTALSRALGRLGKAVMCRQREFTQAPESSPIDL